MRKRSLPELKEFLESKAAKYNNIDFIERDPISVPHRFRKRQDIEIAGFFAAILAWGQRTTIIKKTNELISLMGNAPHEFVISHRPRDLRSLQNFKHRTFNSTDLLYFVSFLRHHYSIHESLEDAFAMPHDVANVEQGLRNFYETFFSLDHAARTRKHIATPARKSACKRINMYLRWMVRKDVNGVDFGLWNRILPAQLVCPCDVHVERVARQLNLLRQKQMNWAGALELTANLKMLDPDDPVKFDFALFGLGVDGEL